MSFIPKNPMTVPKIDNMPPTPPDGCRGLFCDESGWHDIDDNGKVQVMSSITDLGEITTQEELDELVNLSSGWAKFTTKHKILLEPQSVDAQTGLRLDEASTGFDTIFTVHTIKDTDSAFAQYFYVSNYYIKDVGAFYRAGHWQGGGLIIDSYGKFVDSNHDFIFTKQSPTIKADGALTIDADSIHLPYTVLENAVSDGYFFNLSKTPAWFAVPPRIGGTQPYDTTAADAMSIRDLGVIDTQEQLDELQHLPTGYAKFKSKYGVYANNNTFVLSDEVHHGVAYFEYLLETIQSPTEYVVQFLKTSNYSQLQPMVIYRRYRRVAQGNGTYDIHNFSSGSFLMSGDSLNFVGGVLTDVGEFTMNALQFLINGAVEFEKNATFTNGALFRSGTVMFDYGADVRFLSGLKIPNRVGRQVPVAYTSEYKGKSLETNPVFKLTYLTIDTDTVYGVIDSLTLDYDTFPGLSGDSSIDIHFDTGETPPRIAYTVSNGVEETLNWIGTDCALDDGISVFMPSANKHYDICIYYNGTQYVAKVDGFTPATGNVVEG